MIYDLISQYITWEMILGKRQRRDSPEWGWFCDPDATPLQVKKQALTVSQHLSFYKFFRTVVSNLCPINI